MKFLCLSIVSVVILSSCAPGRFIEPLNKKQLAVGVDLGGPIIGFGGNSIPVPLSSVEVGYGLDTNLTIYGGIHTTALMFGNFQIDMGVTYKVLSQNKFIPNVSINPGFNYVQSFSEGVYKFWPTFDANAYWNYGRKSSYVYFGLNNMFELSKNMALNQPQKQRWLLSPQVGHVLKGRNQQFQFITEFKFIGLRQENTYSFIPWKSVFGKYGTTGIYLGFRYLF